MLFLPFISRASDIKVIGTATAKTKEEAQKTAFTVARANLMTELSRIFYSWISICYPKTDYNFDKVAGKVSQMASAYIHKTRTKKLRDGSFQTTVTLIIGTTDRKFTSQILESFEVNMNQMNLRKIRYDHDTAFDALYTVIAHW